MRKITQLPSIALPYVQLTEDLQVDLANLQDEPQVQITDQILSGAPQAQKALARSASLSLVDFVQIHEECKAVKKRMRETTN